MRAPSPRPLAASLAGPLLAALLAGLGAAACGHSGSGSGAPPAGNGISRGEGTPVPGAAEWTWIPFADAFCTDAVADAQGRYRFGVSATGLAISWGAEGNPDLVVFLQGGGACWDFFTCGGAAPLLDKTASAGPFGPDQFAREVYDKYPASWLRRQNLPPSLRDATVVFVPYCTGDVHGGDRVATYRSQLPGVPDVVWHHVGHANVLAFLRRLQPTFPRPGKLVVAGSSGGGFGTLANYETFRAAWPDAHAYLVDDSGPPLEGDAIPPATRAAWYASWNLGASLDAFCPSCRSDLSAGLREILQRHPGDRVALVDHLQDGVIRGFFGSLVLTPQPALAPMPADQFEAALRKLGTDVLDPATANGKYFYPAGTAHPTLEDPGAVSAPPPGLAAWIEQMVSDSPDWRSAADP
jgi:hypothetical protein